MKYNSGGILVEIERHLKLLLQLNANRLKRSIYYRNYFNRLFSYINVSCLLF